MVSLLLHKGSQPCWSLKTSRTLRCTLTVMTFLQPQLVEIIARFSDSSGVWEASLKTDDNLFICPLTRAQYNTEVDR